MLPQPVKKQIAFRPIIGTAGAFSGKSELAS
jgi:hypothetical protein